MDVDNAKPRPHSDAVPRQFNCFDFSCNLVTFADFFFNKIKKKSSVVFLVHFLLNGGMSQQIGSEINANNMIMSELPCTIMMGQPVR